MLVQPPGGTDAPAPGRRGMLGPVLLVDAANVIGSCPSRWWRDRPRAARDLLGRVRRAADAGSLAAPVVVVLEGQARRGAVAGVADGVEVVHAPGHGDDTIVALAEGYAGRDVRVVTADRRLAERVRGSGARVVGPAWLLQRLPD